MTINFRRDYLRALLAGLFTLAGVALVDFFLASIGLGRAVIGVDDLLLAVLVAILVFSLELHHRRELRRQAEKIAIMQEMNHHVRNALQVIIYATANIKDPEMAGRTREAIERIEWALREVLPGEAARINSPKLAPPVPSRPAPPPSPAA
ncbi:MAG: hypothetical protein ACE14M_02055 [Terriglobales bacterium]